MTLSYDIDEEGVFRWQEYSFRTSPAAGIARRRHMVFWSAVYICLATAVFLPFRTPTVALVSYGLAAVCSYATWLVYNDRIAKGLRAHAADPRLKGCLGHAELTLSDVGMREVTQAVDSLVKWSGVIDAVQEGDHIFVRLSTGQAAVIARRSYSGPVPFEEIPRIIRDFKQKHIAELYCSAE